MKKLQTRILLVLFTMMLIPQGMWAQVSTVITQTFNANSITTVTEIQATIPALSAIEGGTWRVEGGASPSYNSGIQITLQHQNNPNALEHNYYPVYYARFSPRAGSLNLVIDQIDLYFAAALQNVSIDAANAGFQVSGPTTTSDGIRYQLQASSSQSASGVFFLLTNGSYTSNETIVLKKIVMTGKVTLSAPYLSYSYDSDKAIFSNFTNYNGFLKGYYSIDYASASLADVTNTEYNGTGFGLQGPCTVTAYVQCGTAKSSNKIGTLFGFAESAMTTTYQPNGTVNAPNIVPELPNGATVAYSNNTNGTTAPTNPINSSTGVITINGADTESYSASYLPSPSPSGVTVLNQTNSNGEALSYKLGSFSLTVNKKSLSSDMIQDIPDQTYSGQNIAPGVTVYDNGVYVPPMEYNYNATNLNAGTGTVEITALASSKKYTGSATKSFNILPRLLTANGTTYSLATDSYVYDGTAKTPAVNITVEKGEPMPVLDTDYTVTYSDNTNVGTGKATITGKGNFTGTVEKSFTITAKSLSGAQFSTIPDQTYTGNEIKPEPTVTLGSATLVKGTDFDFSYSSNTNVPVTANDVPTVTITGKGNFTGTASTTFKIVKATPTVTAPTAKTGLAYTGSAQALVNAGSVTAGTLQYKLGAGGTYGTTIPSATEVGSYAVYYKVVGDANYNDVAEAGPINVTIGKAAGSISYATSSISKTFGDAAFTNALTKIGDGAVSYSSSNTNVATINATSGEVTIVGNGSAVITATVADGTNYTYATKTATYTLSVGTAAMTVSATGYTGAYDGQAHGITVTAPAGATVKYGTSAGTYNLNASPTYTNAGSYTVYYEVTKANYTTVTGSAVVNISKASASISYATASVGKTFGDAPFTNALTKTGDGTVTYSSSNTSVATVNATSGEVTIVGNGSAVITATVADGTNYTYAAKTATYTLSVGTAAMTVSATGYTGAYDGQAHGITVTAPAGATVKYGTSAGTYNLNASPTYTNAGTYTVYYQVTKTGFDTVTGSATVTITKVDARVVYVNYEFTAKIGESFDPPYLTLEPSDLAVTYYSADKDVATVDAQTGEVTLVAPGKVNIYATFDGDENYNSASDYYILTVLQRDIEPIDEDVTIMMNDDNFLYTDDEGNKKEVRLDNAVIYDILFTLNISGDPSESDGYDETEQCVVLNHPVTDREINRIINGGNKPGSEEYADEYTGLTFKVPAGTGYVIIDSRTDGDYQMMVKIGNLAPVAFNHTGREKDSVLYECSVPTWVYVYNGGKVSNARMEVDHRAKKQKGHVKIYSVTRSSAKSSGIERINIDALESERWYDLQGNRIQRPTRKGLYILQGQKVVVK